MSRDSVQTNPGFGVFETDQSLTILLNQPLLAGSNMLLGHARRVANRLCKEMADAQQIETRRTGGQLLGIEVGPIGERLVIGHRFGPATSQKSESLIRVGQIDPNLCNIRILQKPRIELRGGFRHQDNADIQFSHFRGRRPFKERHQVHPLIYARIGFLCRGNELLRKIDNERYALPLLLFFRDAQEKSPE